MSFAALGLSLVASLLPASTPTRPPIVYNLHMDVRGLRYAGAPEIREGTFTSETVILKQRLAYARTAELQSPVQVWDALVPRKLDKGTRLLFTKYAQWCTYPSEGTTRVCLTSENGKWSWNQPYEGLDLTYPFRTLYAICCTWESPPQLQTVIAIAPPVMKEIVDDQALATAVVTLHQPTSNPNSQAISIYCVPVSSRETRSACGAGVRVHTLERSEELRIWGGFPLGTK